ncbi:PAS domain S-box protein [bacterium]|nr:PAS domain S-box protein [bacterium]
MEKSRILIVEDEMIISENIRASLHSLGYTVCGTAANGRTAIEKAGTLRPDIILMDIFLEGDLDGIRTVEVIQRDFDIPVIYLTAHSDAVSLERIEKTMPYGYLVKPFNEIELNGAIKTAIYKHRMERRIKEDEERYRIFFESAHDAIFMLRDLVYIDCNPKALELFACEKEAIIGKTPLDYSPPLQPDGRKSTTVLRELDRQLAKTGFLSFEWQHIRSHTGAIDVEVSVSTISRGDETLRVSFVRDITFRKAAESALRQSESLYKNLITSMPDALSVIDLKGNLTFVSARAAELYGCSDEHDMLGKNALEFIAPEYHEQGRLIFQQAQKGKKVRSLECEMVRRDGSRFHGAINIAAIHDHERKITSLIVTTRDDSLQHTAEEALKESQNQLSFIVNNVAEAIALIKVEDTGRYRFVEVNDVLLKWSQIRKSDILGHTIEEVFRPDIAEQRIRLYTDVVRDRRRVLFGSTYAGDTKRLIETTLIPILDTAGSCSHILAINRDITDEKNVQEAERRSQRALRMASLGTLATGIAHEINQPLTALKVKVDSLLYWGEEDEEVIRKNLMKNLQFISSEAEKISQIITHMRSLVRQERTPRKLININETIRNSISFIRQQLASHGITLQLDLSEKVTFVKTGILPLEQALINLLSNSMHALDTLDIEEKWVRIRTRQYKRTCIIEVTDNGPGIPEDILVRLFEPLALPAEQSQGMGLGLSIVKHLLEEIKGTIEAGNIKGGGARFRIRLPLS